MLKILEIKLRIDKKTDILSKPLGIIMNELLLNLIDLDYREIISVQILKPYSQSIVFLPEDNLYAWKIATLNTEAAEKIAYVVRKKLPDVVNLKEYGITLNVQSKNYIHSATYRQLVEKYFANSCRLKRIDWEFITPTVFYTNDDFTVLPQIENLLDNLICIWNLFAGENVLWEQNLSLNLAQQIYVMDYDFKIKPVMSDDKKIPALTGICHWGLKHNIMAKKIICMLGEYAQYCGIGRKTDWGLGSVKTAVLRK